MSADKKNIIDKLKSEIRCFTRERLMNQKIELTLRNKERAICEELTTVQASTSFVQCQIEDLKGQISELKHQIDMIGICNTSEKSKIENHIARITQHKKGFDELFAKENDLLQLQHDQQRQLREHELEVERKRQVRILETDEQMGKEAARIEKECDEIERECGVVTKRNRAIMLQLRRKLIESEATRKELMKKLGTEPHFNNK